MNKVILIGNVGKDPETKEFEGGKKVANFTLATSKTYKDRDGNRQEQTEWHNIVVFGKQADIVEQYVTKGKKLAIDGEIRTRSWDDKDGNKKYMTEIVCNHFEFLSSPEKDAKHSSSGSYDNEPPAPKPQSSKKADDDDNSLPF